MQIWTLLGYLWNRLDCNVGFDGSIVARFEFLFFGLNTNAKITYRITWGLVDCFLSFYNFMFRSLCSSSAIFTLSLILTCWCLILQYMSHHNDRREAVEMLVLSWVISLLCLFCCNLLAGMRRAWIHMWFLLTVERSIDAFVVSSLFFTVPPPLLRNMLCIKSKQCGICMWRISKSSSTCPCHKDNVTAIMTWKTFQDIKKILLVIWSELLSMWSNDRVNFKV